MSINYNSALNLCTPSNQIPMYISNSQNPILNPTIQWYFNVPPSSSELALPFLISLSDLASTLLEQLVYDSVYYSQKTLPSISLNQF